jgi:trans-aconitate methyltransferase
MIVTDEYAKQLQQMHQKHSIGFGVEPPSKLVEVINQNSIQSILDYGCGEGNMMNKIQELFPNIKIYGYDPGVKRFSSIPEKTDLVYSADVLEHFEPEFIDEGLRKIFAIAPIHYHNIACHPAKKTLPDGRNCHLIVEQPNWWLEKIKSVLDPSYKIVYTNVYHTYRKKRQGTHLEIVIK